MDVKSGCNNLILDGDGERKKEAPQGERGFQACIDCLACLVLMIERSDNWKNLNSSQEEGSDGVLSP